MLDLKTNKIDILGTIYDIIFKDLKDDEYAKENNLSGYIDEIMKRIVIINYNSFENCEKEQNLKCIKFEKYTLRHEIYHAFLTESGLSDSSLEIKGPWSRNEEMIDWLAIQTPKIYKVFKELDIL